MKSGWYHKAKVSLEEKLTALYNEKDLNRDGRYSDYCEITLVLESLQHWQEMCKPNEEEE